MLIRDRLRQIVYGLEILEKFYILIVFNIMIIYKSSFKGVQVCEEIEGSDLFLGYIKI